MLWLLLHLLTIQNYLLFPKLNLLFLMWLNPLQWLDRLDWVKGSTSRFINLLLFYQGQKEGTPKNNTNFSNPVLNKNLMNIFVFGQLIETFLTPIHPLSLLQKDKSKIQTTRFNLETTFIVNIIYQRSELSNSFCQTMECKCTIKITP